MTDNNELQEYYQHIQQTGKLRTEAHAKRWSDGILKTLGLNLDRGAKKALAQGLPEELARSLTRVFWLLDFRNENLSREEFQKMCARRSGNTDADFAYYPILAVFGGLKQLIDADAERKVAESLAPEIRELWEKA